MAWNIDFGDTALVTAHQESLPWLSMQWKTKAVLQMAIAALPSKASYAVYYALQRRFGGLRSVEPASRLLSGIQTWKRIARHRDPRDGVFLEVGTGRIPLAPLAYWLMGAREVVTIDLNRYLKSELLEECIRAMASDPARHEALFGDLLVPSRFAEVVRFGRASEFSSERFLAACGIRYVAPGDAAETGLEPGSIDFHTSYTVFEHIPTFILERILREGSRVVRSDGLFVHMVDYSDHFAHEDSSIAPVHFLRFSERTWNLVAGNRYMYMNRLRHDDFLDLYARCGHRILEAETEVDPRSLDLLGRGAQPLDGRFAGKSREILATTSSWIVSEASGAG